MPETFSMKRYECLKIPCNQKRITSAEFINIPPDASGSVVFESGKEWMTEKISLNKEYCNIVHFSVKPIFKYCKWLWNKWDFCDQHGDTNIIISLLSN